jgi:general secretion pathway protein A
VYYPLANPENERISAMYLDHWELRHDPFRNFDEHTFFYPSSVHEECVARLSYLIGGHYRLGIFVGEPGTGKTTILRRIARLMRQPNDAVVYVNLAGRHGTELPRLVAQGLGGILHDGAAPFAAWREALDLVFVNQVQRVHTVLLFDDIQHAEPQIARGILRLVESIPAGQPGLTVILATDRTGMSKTATRLRALCPFRIELEPWTIHDTAGFLGQAMTSAGCKRLVFDIGAAEEIHRLTDGNPRGVCRLAELCLLAAAADNRSTVTPAIVRSAYQEVHLVPTLLVG